jgi:hypothetical protein
LHCPQAPFDVAVVGLDPVIAISPGCLTTTSMDVAKALQFANRGRIAPETISRQYMDRSASLI